MLTNMEIMECIIIAALLVGNITAIGMLVKMVFTDIVRMARGEA